MALMIKNPPANAGNVRDSGLIPTQEDPLEEGMTTSCLENPWTVEPGGLQSVGSKRVGHN